MHERVHTHTHTRYKYVHNEITKFHNQNIIKQSVPFNLTKTILNKHKNLFPDSSAETTKQMLYL